MFTNAKTNIICSVLVLLFIVTLTSCASMMDGALKDAPVYEGANISGMTPYKTNKVDFMVPPGWVADLPVDKKDKGLANLISGKELSCRVRQKKLGATILVYRWNMATRDSLHEFLVNVLNDAIMDNSITQNARRVFPDQTFPVFEVYTGQLIEKGEPVPTNALLAWRWDLMSRHYSLFCVYPQAHADQVEAEIIALVRTLK